MRGIFKSLLVLTLCAFLLLGSFSLVFSQQKNPLGQYTTIKEYEKATGKKIAKFNEAPMLAELVKQGKLPPVEKRLPEEPAVVEPAEEIGQYGGTWRRAALSPADTMIHQRLGYEPLVRWARDGKTLIPNLCTSWKVTEGGRVYTFYLRKGVKWSDGQPFTADDIMFWYEDVLLNKEISPTIPSWFVVEGTPGKVERVDTYTVRFRFVRPHSLFLDYLAGPEGPGPNLFDFPKHYLRQFHPKYTDPKKLEEMTKEAKFQFWYQLFSNKASAHLNKELPSLRPWVLRSEPTATRIIAERNPYYWKIDTEGNQLPYIDRIAFDMVQNIELINMKAVAGEIDMQCRNIAFPNYTLLMENRAKGGYDVYRWTSGASGTAFFINQNLKGDSVLQKLFRNYKFRLALSLAINRDEINNLIYLGLGDPAYKLLPEAYWDDKELRSLYEYNPTKANQILDELGLKRDKTGYRIRPDGKPLNLTVIVNLAYPIHPDVAELVQKYWDAIGIKTAIDTVSGALWWPRISASEYQIAAYEVDYTTGRYFLTYSRSFIPNASSTYWAPLWGLWYASGGKAEGAEKPTGDALKLIAIFDKIKVTTDEKQRAKLSEDALVLCAKNLFAIPTIAGYPAPCVVKNNFKNVPKSAIYAYPLLSPGYLNLEQFFIKESR